MYTATESLNNSWISHIYVTVFCVLVYLVSYLFEIEPRLNNMEEFDLYRKENTTRNNYKYTLVNAVEGHNRCLQWEYTKPVNIKRSFVHCAVARTRAVTLVYKGLNDAMTG